MRRFHFKHFSLYHENASMKVGTDAILLGAWAAVKPDDWVLDVGTGCGILSLMLAQKGVAKVHAVDLDEASAREAATNFDASQWHDKLFAFHADIRRFDMGCRYDMVISNPPFFLNSSQCEEGRKSQTRHAGASLSFMELAGAAVRLMKPGGRFVLVLPSKESNEFLRVAERVHLYPSNILEIIPVEGREPNRVNMELHFGERPALQRTSLVLRHADKRFTDGYTALLKDFYLGI